MKKIITSILAFIVALCFSVCSVSSLTDTEQSTNRYYFLVPDGTNGVLHKDGGFVKSWYDDGYEILVTVSTYIDSYTIKAVQSEEENVYYADVATDAIMISWNNGVDSSNTVNIGCEYYDPGESENYPDGLPSFNNMIYVCDPNIITMGPIDTICQTSDGEWYYYYGNGCYGFTENGDESDCLRGDHNHAVMGDVDGDGEITIMDATVVQLCVAGYELSGADLSVADVDGDSQLTVFDATLIQEYIAGIINEF